MLFDAEWNIAENILKTILVIQATSTCHGENKFKAFLIVSHPEVYSTLNDNLIIGIIARITSYMLSLLGSFRDLFIICVTAALTARFQQVNKILLDHKGKSMPTSFYAKHRLYYRKLVGLVADVDKAISSITMLALSNNLFFICTSLLNGL